MQLNSMRGTRSAFIAAILLMLVTVPLSCGALAGKVTLPSHSEAVEAKQANHDEWELLDRAFQLSAESDWRAALPLVDSNPHSVRLQALVQDLRVASQGRDVVSQDYEARLSEKRVTQTQMPLDYYLAARLCTDFDQAREWLEIALELDPDFVLATVLSLSLKTETGYYATLDPLRRLLSEHPGCAEAWRLLGMIGPLYARPDLARRAAALEPWSGNELETWAGHYMAIRYLKNQEPPKAIPITKRAPEDDFLGRLIHACALGEAGQYKDAILALESLHQVAPDDMLVLFNLGLIEMQSLHHPDKALFWFEQILEKAHAGHEVSFVRRMQVEAWVRQIRSQS